MADDLTALFESREWVKRRVDRVEFLDLTTVRRTIVLTLDLAAFRRIRGKDCKLIPLGWFAPWANAGAVLHDGEGNVVPYLTSAESDEQITEQIATRLREVFGESASVQDVLERIRRHREDPGRPGHRCASCRKAQGCGRRRELMNDKWGCRDVLELLDKLHESRSPVAGCKELARILLAWQTNFVLLAHLDAPTRCRDRLTLELSYDEELLAWETPWERRTRVLKRSMLSCKQGCECRRHISRGGPFSSHLDTLAPKRLLGFLARSRFDVIRQIGERGFLGLAWHVAWHQASGLTVPHHSVDVILPSELTAVRMRMLRIDGGRLSATRADQVGSRATIVAPQPVCASDSCGGPPTLFSLVMTQRSPTAWYGGAWIALLTGAALLTTALAGLDEVVRHADAGVAALVLTPTLVAAALAVHARSEIAEELTRSLRRLIGAVGVLAATCAISLVVQKGPGPPVNGHDGALTSLRTLRVVWVVAAGALFGIAFVLWWGAHRIGRLISCGRRPSPRRVDADKPAEVFKPKDYPPIPPPDLWLNADEGDLIPWGWLHGAEDQESKSNADESFWHAPPVRQRDALVGWVRRSVGYQPPPQVLPPCPHCEC